MPEEKHFGGVLQTRFHNFAQSKASEIQLAKVWSQHPHFRKIPAQEDFAKKLSDVIDAIKTILAS
ncbi:hypothetical protein D3C87_1831660 [compost metagenome]